MAHRIAPAPLCVSCGIPLDARPFDAHGFATAADIASELVLARFEIPAFYCGVLENFAQFTDRHAGDPAAALTPTLEWSLRLNGRPLAPYERMTAIVNPWGLGTCPFTLRLDERACVEIVVRRVAGAGPDSVTLVGGRIAGRYWYRDAFGSPGGGR